MLKTTKEQRYNAYLDAINSILCKNWSMRYICNELAQSIEMDIRVGYEFNFNTSLDKQTAILNTFPEFKPFRPITKTQAHEEGCAIWFPYESYTEAKSIRLIILAFCLIFLTTDYE